MLIGSLGIVKEFMLNGEIEDFLSECIENFELDRVVLLHIFTDLVGCQAVARRNQLKCFEGQFQGSHDVFCCLVLEGRILAEQLFQDMYLLEMGYEVVRTARFVAAQVAFEDFYDATRNLK